MHLFQIPTLLHSGEILEIAVSNDGKTLATTGDNTILLWNLPLSLDSNASSTISCHSSPVTCICFCPNNSQKIVSADRDGHVYLTSLADATSSSTLVFTNTSSDTSSSLQSIADLSWSIDGRLVAWSTTDCKLFIHDVTRGTIHDLSSLGTSAKAPPKSPQRSVCFDPSGNYLASMGDDTVLYIYQYAYSTSDLDYLFRLVHKVSRHVSKPSLHCKYRRIAWSPDGEFLSIPTATKNHAALVSLIARTQNWENRVSLVGHDMLCETILFLPVLYSLEPIDDKPLPSQVHNVVATGGSDRVLAVWNTTREHPLFVLRDVAAKDIVLLAWLVDGQTLFVASMDGRLSVISFEPNELGHVASKLHYDHWKNLGNASVKPLNYKYEPDLPPLSRRVVPPIEYARQVDALKINSQASNIAVSPTIAESTVITESSQQLASKAHTPSPSPVATTLKRKSVDAGISGPLIPEVVPPPDMDEVGDDANDILKSAMSNRSKQAPSAKPVAAKPSNPQPRYVVSTKDGRKRIQPQLILKHNGGPTPNASSQLNSKAEVDTNDDNTPLMTPLEIEKPTYSVSEDFAKEQKRIRLVVEDGATGNGSANVKKVKRDLEPVRFVGSVVSNPNTSFAKVRLAVPKIRSMFQLNSKREGELFALDIRNGAGNESKPTRITYYKKQNQVWLDFYPRYIQLAVEGQSFWALSTSDCVILTYSHYLGKRLLPPLVLGAPVLFLESLGDFLMAVTSIGQLHVWNVASQKSELVTSIAPLLELHAKPQEDGLVKSDNITMCAITLSGIPLVTLSNGNGYLYNKMLATWQTISESWWAFGSQYWNSLDNSTEEQSIIDLVEQKTNNEIVRKTRLGRSKFFNKISKNTIMKEGYENLENTVSLCHLENRLLCCQILDETQYYEETLLLYCQRLCEMGSRAKLMEVCMDLMGPDDNTDSQSEDSNKKWKSTVCGLNKHKLLKRVILKSVNRGDVQRILDHFARKLGLVDEID